MATADLSDVLSEFARTMLTDFPIQGILDHLVKRIVDIMPVTGAGVTLIAEDLNPRYVTASNASALRFEQLQTDLGEGPCLAAYHTGAPIELPDLRAGDQFPRFSPQALDAGLAAVFTFPMHHGEIRLGALDLYRETPGPLSSQSTIAAQTLADVAAAYLINAQGRADLQVSSDRASEALLHDALTGLPNRTLMLDRLEHAFRHRVRGDQLSAVLFLDLDGFKAVNDTYGHQVGDELLVGIAQRLTGVLRPGDSLGRLGGDEFVVLCEDLNEPAQADMIARRLEAALDLPFVLSAGPVTTRASIGTAFTGGGNDTAEQVLHAADLAMYRTKRRRGAGHQVLELDRLLLGEDQAVLEDALSGAARRGELNLEYQPIVAALDGRVTGAEALIRWEHPIRGAVAPAVLIPLAEQSGEIIDIGRWVLQRAWSDRGQWQGDHAKDLSVSVNVSAHQLMSAGFANTVSAVLATSATDPRLLTLEVTESTFVRDGDRARHVLNDLKDMGVMLALDDFGTGYSSLGYLRRLPLDIVKVDREFVADLRSDGANHTIVSAVIQLAHGLGLTVVSEGVETAAQHRELTALGCDSCQGFYFARPMPSSSLDTLMQTQPASRGWVLPPTATTPTQ
jgi:diguanylate cyclase (GGDEF)-like protein